MSETTTPKPGMTVTPVLIDTGTRWRTAYVPSDEYLDEITPEGLQWAADELRKHALAHIGRVFDWIVADIPSSGKPTIAYLMAEGELCRGRSLHYVLDDLLLAAERDMPCADERNPHCGCGFCSFGRDDDAELVDHLEAQERLIATGGAL